MSGKSLITSCRRRGSGWRRRGSARVAIVAVAASMVVGGLATPHTASGAALASDLPARVARDATGHVRRVVPVGDALTGTTSGRPVAIARAYLASRPDLFERLAAGNVLQVVSDLRNPATGVTTVVFQQLDRGIELTGVRIAVSVGADGRVLLVNGSPRAGTLSGTAPAVSAESAVRGALGHDGLTPLALSSRGAPIGTSRRTAFVNGVSAGVTRPTDLTAELVAVPGDANTTRLAWRTTLEESPVSWPEVVVDAQSGAEISRRNLYQDQAEGNVYTQQHPGIAGAAQSIVSFTGASFDNSGWVADRRTSGNNVNAYQDKDGDNSSDYQPETPASGDPAYQHFDDNFTNAYGTSGGTDVTTDQAAVVTQLFYYANVYHDYMYGLGFTEANRNFQSDNFGRGGSGGDPVLAEADDSWATQGCNANFFTPADGSSPRMQMFVGKSSCGNNFVQRAMNGDTVFHESSHGLSSRLVGGGNLGPGEQTNAMGEGWGDFFATSYWNDPVYGEYNNGNATTGIRRVAYDTSTQSYSDLCSGGCEVHNDGEIWASTLWSLRTAFVDRYGYSAARPTTAPANPAGNRRAEQLVVDAMLLSSTSPDFLDMRDSIIAADVARYGAADRCLIWRVFAGRGMGQGAVSATQSSVTAATDLPAACMPTASIGGPYSTPEGSTLTLDGSASTAGTDSSAGALTYAWDLDNDGQYDDATGPMPTFGPKGDNGTFAIGLRVTNASGLSATASTTVSVTNVKPTVTLASGQVTSLLEGGTLSVGAGFTDPGWLDTHTATIDWGTGAAPEAVSPSITVAGGPGVARAGTVSGSHQYGDNGSFTVKVTVTDDDGGTGSAQFVLTVNNVAPTAALDPTGSVSIGGSPTWILHKGQTLTASGASTDPGSDDLIARWTWGDGTPATLTTSLVNPPNPDPLPSPSVQPRSITDTKSHVYSNACLFTLGFDAKDDDGGVSPTATGSVVVVGNAREYRGPGYWYQQYRPTKGGALLPSADLACYLRIVNQMSAVFSEVTNLSASTAGGLLKGSGSDAARNLDRQLLTAWLNFANGAVELSTPVDVTGDRIPDTTFGAAMATAEIVRTTPSSTRSALLAQAARIETINERDGG